MRPVPQNRARALFCAALGALTLASCGDEEQGTSELASLPAPDPASFPDPPDSLEELLAGTGESELVVSPAGQTFTVGKNRLGFGVFTVEREQVTDAQVALYAAHGASGEVRGPFPARVESLETEPAFTARNTAADPDAARVVYVSELSFDRPGEWRLAAVVREGEETEATRLPSVVATREGPVPAPGEPAPRVHTPTADEVADVSEIDTRVPPSTMHEEDLAEVLGKEPVVLLFATPALCQSRVCGPVVDVAEQVKRDRDEDAAFIHMEIFEDNTPPEPRPQVEAYRLRTEPWLFVIDEEGKVDTRIEGAFSVAELDIALNRVSG